MIYAEEFKKNEKIACLKRAICCTVVSAVWSQFQNRTCTRADHIFCPQVREAKKKFFSFLDLLGYVEAKSIVLVRTMAVRMQAKSCSGFCVPMAHRSPSHAF